MYQFIHKSGTFIKKNFWYILKHQKDLLKSVLTCSEFTQTLTNVSCLLKHVICSMQRLTQVNACVTI